MREPGMECRAGSRPSREDEFGPVAQDDAGLAYTVRFTFTGLDCRLAGGQTPSPRQNLPAKSR